MSKNNLEIFKKLVSNEKSGWFEKAKWRQENQAWLDISFAIAVKILSAFRANKISDTFPKNQKELSEALNCSPQYVNKLLRGSENLQLETISKIEKILNINLIQVPDYQKTVMISGSSAISFSASAMIVDASTKTQNYEPLKVVYVSCFSLEKESEELVA